MSKKIYGRVYCVTNLINGKQYVGKTTTSLEVRWTAHCRARRATVLTHAIRKYGAENFSIKQVASATTLESLNARECEWIKAMDCRVPRGYNLKAGGDGGLHSPVTIAKMRAAFAEPAYKARQKEGLRRFWSDPGNKRRIVENLVAIRRRNYEQGKRHKSHSETFEKNVTPEWRDRRAAMQREIWSRPEYRAKLKQIWSDSAKREARAAAVKAALEVKNRDPEWRAFRSADMKRVRREALERQRARKEGRE